MVDPSTQNHQMQRITYLDIWSLSKSDLYIPSPNPRFSFLIIAIRAFLSLSNLWFLLIFDNWEQKYIRK